MSPEEMEAAINGLLRRVYALEQAKDKRTAEYERILRLILNDINIALGFVARDVGPNAPLGLDYRSLKYMIDEALK